MRTAGALATHIATVRRLNRGEPFVGRPTAVLLLIAGVRLTAYLVMSA